MFTPGDDENEPEDDWLPPATITRKDFLEWRHAGYAEVPAQEFTNPVWLWLIDKNLDAYRANTHFEGPDPYDTDSPAGWCFNRYGRTVTDLPDGRRIIIAGEHEDHYDPDFFIYNDVVVAEKDGSVRIFGYPEEHFPPTDFHTATWLGKEILLVGSLGYPEQRKHGETQVYLFNPETLKFREVRTTGENPGWISKHQADLIEGAVVIRGGKVDHGPDKGGYLDNFDSWRLSLDTWQWTRLTRCKILRWRFFRANGDRQQLYLMRMKRFDKLIGSHDPESENSDDGPAFDPELLSELYLPPVAHEALKKYEWYDPKAFLIDGTRVGFDENFRRDSILMTVEGELPEEMLEEYVEGVRQRLSKLEKTEYQVERWAGANP